MTESEKELIKTAVASTGWRTLSEFVRDHAIAAAMSIVERVEEEKRAEEEND